MKVIDLRIERIEPEIGEEVIIETDEMTYMCIVDDTEGVTCEGCLLHHLQGCGRIACYEDGRKDKKNIVLKCKSRKRREVENA